MSHVPDDIILRHVKHVMQCDGQFNNTERGGKVSSRFGDRLDEFPTKFVGELFEFLHVKTFHIMGVVDCVQDGFGGWAGVGWAVVGCVMEACGGWLDGRCSAWKGCCECR